MSAFRWDVIHTGRTEERDDETERLERPVAWESRLLVVGEEHAEQRYKSTQQSRLRLLTRNIQQVSESQSIY